MNDNTPQQTNTISTIGNVPNVNLSKIKETLRIDTTTFENAVRIFTKVQQSSTLSSVLESNVGFS